MNIRVMAHCHSVWSYDGHWSLDRLAWLGGKMGWNAILMTEHDSGFLPSSFGDYRNACDAASTARCRLIPGIEYSSPNNDIHILTWGLTRFLAEHRPVAETLSNVVQAGGVAVLAHPVRRDAWAKFDQDWIPKLAAIELWNRKSDSLAPGEHAWALIQQTGLPATVGCDFHNIRQIYPLTLRLKGVPTVDETQIVQAIRSGEFQACAFGQPLVDGQDELRARPHQIVDRIKRRLIRRRTPVSRP